MRRWRRGADTRALRCLHRGACAALGVRRKAGKAGSNEVSLAQATEGQFRSLYAALVAAAGRLPGLPAGHVFQIRLEGAFDAIPRELFLPPGPWLVTSWLAAGGPGAYVETPGADPRYIYQDVLVALDKERGINNGQPSAHARFMSAVAPQPGETVVHIGAGTGYYSAILSMLVAPGGRVEAFEVDERLAAAARRNLEAFENVSVTVGDAIRLAIPGAHVIYVNAGLRCPPAHWLKALHPGGRMFLPWFAAREVSIALAIRRAALTGYAVDPFMPARFIACAGIPEDLSGDKLPNREAAWATRALHLASDRPPDATATAIYREMWFSSRHPEHSPR
jgi:protein-L-isoaspartate(D-aspartate) O-methyltransferase